VVCGGDVLQVTLFSSLFVFIEFRCQVSASFTDISGLTVAAFDFTNCSWYVFRFIFVLNISE